MKKKMIVLLFVLQTEHIPSVTFRQSRVLEAGSQSQPPALLEVVTAI